jgi:hypothetical protein
VIYVHPVLGAVSVGLLIWIGLQGLRGRHPKGYAGPARRRHATWVPWIYGGICLSLVTGMASTAWLREDLGFAASRHFWLGWATALALGMNAALWWMKNLERAARLHRWLGIGALILAAIQAALGLGLLP